MIITKEENVEDEVTCHQLRGLEKTGVAKKTKRAIEVSMKKKLKQIEE